jgi:hypothetical protein
MQGNAGQHTVAGILGDQIAPVVGRTLVEDRNDIDIEAAATELDLHAMMLRDKLIASHQVAIGLTQPLGEPIKELRLGTRRLAALT